MNCVACVCRQDLKLFDDYYSSNYGSGSYGSGSGSYGSGSGGGSYASRPSSSSSYDSSMNDSWCFCHRQLFDWSNWHCYWFVCRNPARCVCHVRVRSPPVRRSSHPVPTGFHFHRQYLQNHCTCRRTERRREKEMMKKEGIQGGVIKIKVRSLGGGDVFFQTKRMRHFIR